MSEAAVRAARLEDLPHLAAIEASGAETFAQAGQPLADGSPPAPPDQWAEALAAGLLWVAAGADGAPIGFLAGRLEGDSLYIEEVDVIMERQRQGHGRRLVEAAIGHARRARLASVTLTTFRLIPWNAPFYASLGFVELAPAAMPVSLARHLAEEASRGLEDRCAMRLAL